MTQLSLTTAWVDLSPDEHAQAGVALALAYQRLLALDIEHKERRVEMKKEREAVLEEIAHRAAVVAQGREERPVGRTR